MLKIAPSLLAADFLNLGSAADFIDREADLYHLDVMDGTFVPNISFGFPVVEAFAKVARKPLDVHLMIVNPEKYVERFVKAGAAMVSFHYEAAGRKTGKIISMIRECGARAGVVINPDCPVESLYPYIGKADFFLIMSVFAGFGGQKFIPSSIEKVAALKAEMIRLGFPDTDIEVDGGIGPDNASVLEEAGATILVAGSSVFKAEDPAAAVRAMRGVR